MCHVDAMLGNDRKTSNGSQDMTVDTSAWVRVSEM
jgi:hypothetical protein